MRKLRLAVVVWVLIGFCGHNALGQMNRKSVKKNNKRISNFRGKKDGFDKSKKYNAIGLSLNALNYFGDIVPRSSATSSDISFTRPAFGLFFAHRFGPRYTLQAQFMAGNLKATDRDSADPNDLKNSVFRFQRNLSFRNQIKELSVVAVFDLFKNESNYMGRVSWTPYGFIGVAGFLNNPEAQAPATDLQGNALPEAGKWVKLRPLGTEGQYSTLDPTDVNYGIKHYKVEQIAIPFGIGIRLKLNQVMDFSAEWGFRYTFTDYLDDVSQNYVGLDKLKSPLAQAMSYRTNELPTYPRNPVPSGIPGVDVQAGYGSEHPDNKRGSNGLDRYMVTTFKVGYILGATFHKAKFR